MAVVTYEPLMAPGSIRINLNFTEEAYAKVWDADSQQPANVYLRLRNLDGDLLFPPFVLRQVDGDEKGLIIGGPGILWSTGDGDVGPPIDDRRYFSGVSRLSDGEFELGDLIYWKLSQGSTWTTTADARTGALAAYHTAGTNTDDPLASDEVFPAAAGEEWTAGVWVKRPSGAVGRIHLRLTFGGRFTPSDVLVHDWNNTSEFPGDMDASNPAAIYVGRHTTHPLGNERKQILLNGGAETGTLANWVSYSGTWGPTTTNPRSGAYSFDIGGTTPAAFRQLVSDSSVGGLDQGYDVLPGETYVIGDYIQPGAGTDGKAYIHVLLGGVVAGVPNTPIHQVKSIEIENNSVTAGAWNLVAVEVQVPADAVLPYLSISKITEDNENGNWYSDDTAVIRTVGNRGYLAGGTAWIFVPLRTYKWSAKVEVAELISGSMRFGMTLLGVGRPNIYIESQPFDVHSPTGLFEWSFTPPSGYEFGSPVIISEDLYGGYFTLTDMHCYDQDSSTLAIDTDSALACGWTPLVRTFTAPVGTDRVWMEVVAEAGAGDWAVDDAGLVRTSVPISTGADIVTELLLDPLTGDPMSIGAGAIVAPETIPYDWHLVRTTPGAALDHLCRVVYPGGLEYRVTVAESPLLDVAPAATLFEDHTPDSVPDDDHTGPVVLLGGMVRDPDVEDVDPPETNTSDRATEIVVIGADRTLLSGRTVLITASAQVPGPVEYDLNNRPIVRRKYVIGTVDHLGFAQALADDLAEREANPPLFVTIELNEIDEDTATALDIPLRPTYDVGDWIYVDKPEAGLHDPTNPVAIDGTVYFPRKARLLDREQAHTDGIVELVWPDGTAEPIDVIWSKEAETRIGVGDRLPEWVWDPQGRAEGVSYLEWRRSRPPG